MRKILFLMVIVALIAGAVGYSRGWFSVSREGQVDFKVDAAKFEDDRAALAKTVSEKVKAMKIQVSGLFKKSDALQGDAKTETQKELAALEKEQDRLEQQLGELNEAGSDRFVGVREDLSKNLAAVERKIADLSKKLETSESK